MKGLILDEQLKLKALTRLARTEGETVQKALSAEGEKILASLLKETDYHHLANQLKYLDIFAFRIPKQALSIVEAFLRRLNTFEITYRQEYGGSDNSLRRFQNENTLTVEALNILNNIRYFEFENIFKIILEYTLSEHLEINKQAFTILKSLAGYDLYVVYGPEKSGRGLGFQPQEQILSWVEAFSKTKKLKYFDAIISVCEEILAPTIRGTTSSYKTVTFETAAIPDNQILLKLRKRTIKVLWELYEPNFTIKKKVSIISALNKATDRPHAGNYSDELESSIVGNANEILGYYLKLARTEEPQILQKIENKTYWIFYRFNDEKIKNCAFTIRDLLDKNTEYQIFKILIGYDNIFGDWQKKKDGADAGEEWRKEEEYREKEAEKLAESINQDNYEEWRSRIQIFSQTETKDGATFPKFGHFLNHLAKQSPEIALKLIHEIPEEIKGFFSAMFMGIWESKQKEQFKKQVDKWIEKGENLYSLARIFEFSGDFDSDVLNSILNKAERTKDSNAIAQIIASFTAGYNEERRHLIPNLFLRPIESLTKLKEPRWINLVWFRKDLKRLIPDIEDGDLEIVLDSLVLLDEIDYHAEAILFPISERAPARVIIFFKNRILAKKDKKMGMAYRPVPFFEFQKLKDPLSKIPEQAVDIVRSLYDDKYGLFIYEGGALLKNIFSEFNKSFEQKLKTLVRSKDETSIKFVLAILRNYEGEAFLHPICKELVKAVGNNEQLLNEIKIVLESMGVVSGEYGRAEAYERKRLEIAPWLEDEDERIRGFAEDYTNELDRIISADRKRVDEEIKLMKQQRDE